jgi:hypothetical protein
MECYNIHRYIYDYSLQRQADAATCVKCEDLYRPYDRHYILSHLRAFVVL